VAGVSAVLGEKPFAALSQPSPTLRNFIQNPSWTSYLRNWHTTLRQLCIPCFVSDFQVVPRQPHRQKTSSRPRYRRSPSQWPNKVVRLPPSSLCLLEMVEPERSVHSSPPQILYLHGGELPIRTFCWHPNKSKILLLFVSQATFKSRTLTLPPTRPPSSSDILLESSRRSTSPPLVLRSTL